MKAIIIALALLAASLAATPPIFDYQYHTFFTEHFTVDQTTHSTLGQIYYDPQGRERVERAEGQYDIFCGSILPNISADCTHLTVDNRRWILFAKREQCCFCCDSAHGCGILKPDWLADAKYLGIEKVNNTDC